MNFQNPKTSYMISNLVFDKKQSTSNVLIHLKDKIPEQLHKGNFGCGIFVNFWKAFGTVNHNILNHNKLTYYDVRAGADREK